MCAVVGAVMRVAACAVTYATERLPRRAVSRAVRHGAIHVVLPAARCKAMQAVVRAVVRVVRVRCCARRSVSGWVQRGVRQCAQCPARRRRRRRQQRNSETENTESTNGRQVLPREQQSSLSCSAVQIKSYAGQRGRRCGRREMKPMSEMRWDQLSKNAIRMSPMQQ
eukprot:374587-Pleurochrysis_carterae.AAC.3